MITYKTGDIFSEDVEALVNPVNCVGAMGKGLALEFKRRFPENFLAYAQACRNGVVKPGNMFVYETGQIINPKYIINFPTKRHWRDASRIEDIQSGLIALRTAIEAYNITSIAVPALGSGLGQLPWGQVRTLIDTTMPTHPIPTVNIIVFEPIGG